ncbi:MAG: hypothetical protein H7647_01300, partial [Candidatus Heimdallarchaeota archaeon]|nr:hypothetical protein [Candidatus Heimdallarchaeota archaeon]
MLKTETEFDEIVRVYNLAREDFKVLVGETPENYRVLLFVNPDLHISITLFTEMCKSGLT